MFRSPLLSALTAVLLGGCASIPNATPTVVDVPAIHHPDGESAAWWYRDGAAQAAERGALQGRAHNVILFIGDGMSLPTVAAARILEGQRHGAPGEENRLAWETWPATALSKTYDTDSQTPDSAGTMSAMATGAKTRAYMLSTGQQAKRGDCAAAKQASLLTLWELAAASGMATGVVTTTRVTHATPAATFSHEADRNWESDADMPADAKAAGCIDIARQLVETPYGHGPDVLLGGGRAQFLPADAVDPEYPGAHGLRTDGRDLIATWRQRHRDGAFVWNAAQFVAAPLDGPLLGLFEPSHLHFEHERPQDRAGEPSLAAMTRAAIARLSRHREGYVLLVEGGRIDHAHHWGNAYRALDETIALSDAVRVADRMTSPDDTLILVTADHSHTLTFAGYPVRGNPMLGKVRGTSGEEGDANRYAHDALGKPYTTLSYANGPGYTGASDDQPAGPKRYLHAGDGYVAARDRPDLTNIDTEDPDYLQEATAPFANESHGGDDVGVWARGPGSAAVRGSLEQNALYHLMLQATPRLRAALCAKGDCDAQGVPVTLPDPAAFATPR